MALVDRAARGHGLPGHYQGAQHEKRQGKDIMAYFGRAVLAIGILLVPIRAAAGPADCVLVDNDLDRLACYDREIGRTPSVTVEPTQTAWTVRREKSDFKDTTDVYMTVKSDEPVACGFLGSQQLTLYLRCQENTTAFIIATHCHVTSGHGG